MLAWKPVSEAAALLGVSERTVWRRIKSDSIPSRSENSRTLVAVECDEAVAGQNTAQQLSRVTAARLSVHKIDGDGLDEVLSAVRDFKQLMQREVVRTRRSVRALASLLIVMMIAGGVGVWYHLDLVNRLRLDHDNALAAARMDHKIAVRDLKSEYDARLAEARETAANNAGKAKAHKQEVQRLARQQQQSLENILALEQQNIGIGEQVSTKLTQFAEAINNDQSTISEKDTRITELVQQVDKLESQLRETERINHTARMIESRLAAAAQRSAAKHRGLIQGLQIHLDYKQQIEKRLRDQLATAGGTQWAYSNADTRDSDKLREEIWQSVVGTGTGSASTDGETVSAGDSGFKWLPLLKRYAAAFIPGPAEAVSASPPVEVAVAQ